MKRKDVYDYFFAHPGQYFTAPQVIEALGGIAGSDSARRMCRDLAATGFLETGPKTIRAGRGAETYRLRADAPDWPTAPLRTKVTKEGVVVAKKPQYVKPRKNPVWKPTTREGRATALDILSYFGKDPLRVVDVARLCEASLTSVSRCTGWLEHEGCLLPHPDGGYTRTHKHPPALRFKEPDRHLYPRGLKTAHLAGLLAGF